MRTLPDAVFVRHAESTGNKRKLMKGIVDYPADPDGKAEERKLAARVADYRPDVVISSPLKRAVSPARAIAKKAGVALVISDDFLPIDLGSLHGQSMQQGEPRLRRAAEEHPDEPVAPGGESFRNFLMSKVRPGYDRVKQLMAQGIRPVVVTHSRNLREIGFGLLGQKPADPTQGGPDPGGFLTLRGRRLELHCDGGQKGE